MRPIPLVRKAALAPAVSYLTAEGVPIHRYLGKAGLSAPAPDGLETLMPLYQLCAFLTSVAQSKGINDLGFRIGGHTGIQTLDGCRPERIPPAALRIWVAMRARTMLPANVRRPPSGADVDDRGDVPFGEDPQLRTRGKSCRVAEGAPK